METFLNLQNFQPAVGWSHRLMRNLLIWRLCIFCSLLVHYLKVLWKFSTKHILSIIHGSDSCITYTNLNKLLDTQSCLGIYIHSWGRVILPVQYIWELYRCGNIAHIGMFRERLHKTILNYFQLLNTFAK